MKLKVVNIENGDYNKAIKTALIIGAISYGKIYELLHKQIWRKAPSRIGTYSIPSIPTFNGRPVTFIRHWNIKSPSTVPYSRDGGDNTFGLNQLFMEQDYRKEYVGNPKDGIYHDDCYITPKIIPATNEGYYDCWGYYTDSSYDSESMSTSYTISQTFDKQDAEGNVIINSVTLETYLVNTTNYKRLRIDNVIGDDTIIELGSFDPLAPSIDGIISGQSNSPYGLFGFRKWRDSFDELSNHGTVVSETQTTSTYILEYKTFDYGWIRVYQDGTVIEYVPESNGGVGADDMAIISPAHYKILPMMYTDTGDLVMDRVEFVEKWNNYFDLIVHEDSEWWQSFLKPIGAIISLVIAINTGLYFGVDTLMFNVAVAGGIASAIGILSDNTTLSLIGGILIGYVGLEKMLVENAAQNILNNAPPSMSIGAAKDLANTLGYKELFAGFISNAGLDNWAKIGSSAFSLYNQAQAIGMNNVSNVEDVIEESGMRATIRNEDEEDEVMRVIRI